ncbi:MAG: hypothetical protein CSB33_01965 [Desulfobacterales bacterium]|nr:MAG: hypothetical protein CSB33_01965 [Desulfobacterales bacterium]
MILSFHPVYVGDVNRLCAGRPPDGEDEAAIRNADAVILPQGCSGLLCRMAQKYCGRVFPDYGARLRYPDKIGQIRAFMATGAPHPFTEYYFDTDRHYKKHGRHITPPDCGFPLMFKYNWGGEGRTVFPIRDMTDYRRRLREAGEFERAGQKGFMVQEFVPAGNRSLRVVVIGRQRIAYWRIEGKQGGTGVANLSRGGEIDYHSEPDRMAAAIDSLEPFLAETGINLAGFDFIFDTTEGYKGPLFLEYNYYFGRRGLGGSERYYDLLIAEIDRWLKDQGLR